MTSRDFKYLYRKMTYALCDKAFNIANNSKYDGYQRSIVSLVFKFTSDSVKN